MTALTTPGLATAAVDGACRFWLGYNAAIEVFLTDPDTCRAMRWDASWVPWADIYTGAGAAPERIALTGFVASQSRGLLTIPKVLVNAMTAGSPSDTTFAARAIVGFTDAAHNDFAFDDPLYLLPLDPSRANGVGP